MPQNRAQQMKREQSLDTFVPLRNSLLNAEKRWVGFIKWTRCWMNPQRPWTNFQRMMLRERSQSPKGMYRTIPIYIEFPKWQNSGLGGGLAVARHYGSGAGGRRAARKGHGKDPAGRKWCVCCLRRDQHPGRDTVLQFSTMLSTGEVGKRYTGVSVYYFFQVDKNPR